MIIRELKLYPFAGLAFQDLKFAEGLNVVVGPNEAGKSTIVNALKLALFFPTQYTRTQYNKEIERFMPLGGGDTIQVELAFDIEPGMEVYRLFKSWGAIAESRLITPEGALLTLPQTVQERMRELLVLREGTYHSVLFAYQAHLGMTLEVLRSDPEPQRHLADLLRRSIFETDGVSVDLLEQRLKERGDESFKRWDSQLVAPQDNRGIDRPWERGVGLILRAYYQKEYLRRDLEEAREHEHQLDGLNDRIRQVSEELEALRGYVRTNQQLVDDARQRLLLEAQLNVLQDREGQLKEVFQRWPVLEQKVEVSAVALEKLGKKKSALDKELVRAQAYESQKEDRDRFKQAEKKHEVIEKAKAALSSLKAVTAKDMAALEELNLRLTECQASLKAGKLSLTFTPRKPVSVHVTKDLEAESEYVLKAGHDLELVAGGMITMHHSDWDLTVKSGEVEFERVAEDHEQTTTDFKKMLNRLRVKDVTTARQVHDAYITQVNAIKGLEGDLEEILAGQSYEKLKTAVQQALRKPPPRISAEVALELGSVATSLTQTENDLAENRKQLKKWQETYESLDSLVEELADKRGEVKRLKQKLAKLRPLPPGITDLEAFIKEFEGQAAQLEKKQNEWHELLLERSELQGQAPNETVEELVPQLREAESRFEETLREGEALTAIQHAFAEVKAEMDGQTLTPWLGELERLLGGFTEGRYVTLELSPQADEKAVRQDGLCIPGLLLSGGAKVSIGLAVRLSMASHFLHGLKGFLVMDDPLVDLDEFGRQQAAAQIIQEFAKEKQVIVLTCKERHYELLGGHCIVLQPEYANPWTQTWLKKGGNSN